MGDPTAADEEILRQARCKICKSPPSKGPLLFSDGRIICGRCPGSGLPAGVLEVFAKKFKYPCRYQEQGCEVMLPWDEAVLHEESCEHLKTKCFLSSCSWAGKKVQLKEHFQNEHPASTFDETSSFKLSDITSNLEMLILIGGSAFKIELDATANFVKCGLEMVFPESNTDKSKYSWKIEFCNGPKSLSLLRETSGSDAAFHMSKTELQRIFNELENVTMRITIDYSGKLAIHDDLSQLKCPVCLDEMASDVYGAVCGHSVCNICSKKLLTCPLCNYRGGNKMFHIRNYALENCRDSVCSRL